MPPRDPTAPTAPTASVVAGDHAITVRVSGSGYSGGSSGSAGSGGGGGGVVYMPAPCWRQTEDTGKQYYDGAQAVIASQGSKDWSRPGYEKFKDDVTGHWYTVHCDFANWPDQGDQAGYVAFVTRFGTLYPAEFFPLAKTVPEPEVSPVVLREAAVKSLFLPDPELNWNPKLIGNQGTLVNLDTWFWLDKPSTATREVRAAAGGHVATVTASFGGMDITAPGEEGVTCIGAGTPYTAAAHDTSCSLAFSRASSALGERATPVTVQARWKGTWTLDRDDQGPISTQPVPADTTNIQVGEVQTLVTGAR